MFPTQVETKLLSCVQGDVNERLILYLSALKCSTKTDVASDSSKIQFGWFPSSDCQDCLNVSCQLLLVVMAYLDSSISGLWNISAYKEDSHKWLFWHFRLDGMMVYCLVQIYIYIYIIWYKLKPWTWDWLLFVFDF